MMRERVDMSPEAIAARLEAMAELYRVGMSLCRAKRIGKAADERETAPAESEKPSGDQ